MGVLGFGEGENVQGGLGLHHCPICKMRTEFTAGVTYSYAHILYVFSFLTGKKYFIRCEHCGNTALIDQDTALKILPEYRVPFFRKWGWLLGLMVAAPLVTYLIVVDRQNRQRQSEAYMAAPKVDDLYLANLAEIEGSGFESDGGKAYGAMRVTATGRLGLTFATTNQGFNSTADLKKALRQSGFLTYDYQDTLRLTPARIKNLWQKGVIFEVRRE